MIIKSFETKKINIKQNKLILFYGKNDQIKKEAIENLTNSKKQIVNYEQNEILDNEDYFVESISSKSLFEEEKVIIIKRATDKIINLLEKIRVINLEDILIIIVAENLEKKSKLRSIFEKDKELISVAFYPDTTQTLSNVALNFVKEKKIVISQENLNLIINRSQGDRKILLDELEKIENYCKNGKKLTRDYLLKLTNLTEDYSITELIDNCLAKNEKKTLQILNENNFTKDDCVMIARVFINKSKKMLTLCEEFERNKNIEITISSAKPPIFWKDKEITKLQIKTWSSKNIKQLIYDLSKLEHQIKKNFDVSLNLMIDFIVNIFSWKTNNLI